MVLSDESFKPGRGFANIQEDMHHPVWRSKANCWIMELDHPRFERKYDLSTLRTGVVGGAEWPVELVETDPI